MLVVAIVLSVVAYLLVGAVIGGLVTRYGGEGWAEGDIIGIVLLWPLAAVFFGVVATIGGLLEIVNLVGGKHPRSPQDVRTLIEELEQLRDREERP